MAKTRISPSRIKDALELLRFISTLDDNELIKCSLESVMEILEDELKKA